MDRQHADQIRVWLDNEDSVVRYSHKGERWVTTTNPNWCRENYRYVTVPKKFEKHWEAYLQGLLHQFDINERCFKVVTDLPVFNQMRSHYRIVEPRDIKDIMKQVDFVAVYPNLTDLTVLDRERLVQTIMDLGAQSITLTKDLR